MPEIRIYTNVVVHVADIIGTRCPCNSANVSHLTVVVIRSPSKLIIGSSAYGPVPSTSTSCMSCCLRRPREYIEVSVYRHPLA